MRIWIQLRTPTEKWLGHLRIVRAKLCDETTCSYVLASLNLFCVLHLLLYIFPVDYKRRLAHMNCHWRIWSMSIVTGIKPTCTCIYVHMYSIYLLSWVSLFVLVYIYMYFACLFMSMCASVFIYLNITNNIYNCVPITYEHMHVSTGMHVYEFILTCIILWKLLCMCICICVHGCSYVCISISCKLLNPHIYVHTKMGSIRRPVVCFFTTSIVVSNCCYSSLYPDQNLSVRVLNWMSRSTEIFTLIRSYWLSQTRQFAQNRSLLSYYDTQLLPLSTETQHWRLDIAADRMMC